MFKKMISTSLAVILIMSSAASYADITAPVSPVVTGTPTVTTGETPPKPIVTPSIVTSPAPIVITPPPIGIPPIIITPPRIVTSPAPIVVGPTDIQKEAIKKEIQRLLAQLELLKKKVSEPGKKPQTPANSKAKGPMSNNGFNGTINNNSTVNSNNTSTNNINIVNNFTISNNGTQTIVFDQNQLGQLNAMLQPESIMNQQKDVKGNDSDIKRMIKALEQKIAKLYGQIKEEIKVLPVDLLVIGKDLIKTDANMVLKDDIAFMPVALFEKSFDVKVRVDEKKKRVFILSDEGIAELSWVESKMLFNGKEIKTNVKPFMMKEKLMIPVNQLARVYSVKVHYKKETNTLFINDLDVPKNK